MISESILKCFNHLTVVKHDPKHIDKVASASPANKVSSKPSLRTTYMWNHQTLALPKTNMYVWTLMEHSEHGEH